MYPTTVVVKSIHMAECIEQNGQLLTLTNNLVGSGCQRTTHDVIFPPHPKRSESITVDRVFKESPTVFIPNQFLRKNSSI